MSLTVYKLLHLFGVFVVIVSITTLAIHAALGGKKEENRLRGLFMGLHGLGAVIILISGFGMLARLGIASSFPFWIVLKVILWVLIGGLLAVPYRKPALALPIALALPFLALLAAYIGLYKPL